jgi:hypothetical protein
MAAYRNDSVFRGVLPNGRAPANAGSHHVSRRKHMNRWTRLITVSTLITAAALVACGGAQRNHYRASLGKQESCCKQLPDDGSSAACMNEIPKVDDPAAETAQTNQETFACVERYFMCDVNTGRATKESAQAQLDCLNELESTQTSQ